MSRAVKAIPDGLHSLTPYLIIRDADKALEHAERVERSTAAKDEPRRERRRSENLDPDM